MVRWWSLLTAVLVLAVSCSVSEVSDKAAGTEQGSTFAGQQSGGEAQIKRDEELEVQGRQAESLAFVVQQRAGRGDEREQKRAQEVGGMSGRGERSLVGVWQASKFMAAGWEAAYQFYADGRYRYNPSQMDCAARERWVQGRWRVEGSELVLVELERKVIVGGKEVKASGSCGTPTEIEGGEERIEELAPGRERRLKIEWLGEDEEVRRPHVKLGGRDFWRFAEDPEQYPETLSEDSSGSKMR